MLSIDLNCDIGEGFGPYVIQNQAEILQYVTSANIACGYHSGDPSIMHETVKLAIENNVKIGAHPGLPDLLGFGRRNMNISPREAYDMVVYQIGALQGFLTVFNEPMQHVKPHGALYNMAAKDQVLAEAIAQAVYDVSPQLILFGLSESELTKAGEKIGLKTAHEVFADRTYQNDGTLTPRSIENAIITDQNKSLEQILRFVEKNEAVSIQGDIIPLRADSICVHGDEEQALQFVKNIKQTLAKNTINVQPFNK